MMPRYFVLFLALVSACSSPSNSKTKTDSHLPKRVFDSTLRSSIHPFDQYEWRDEFVVLREGAIKQLSLILHCKLPDPCAKDIVRLMVPGDGKNFSLPYWICERRKWKRAKIFLYKNRYEGPMLIYHLHNGIKTAYAGSTGEVKLELGPDFQIRELSDNKGQYWSFRKSWESPLPPRTRRYDPDKPWPPKRGR